jgi:hypothetical protein
MYLSKPLLFIIIVVVLFIGGTSGLIYNVKGGSKRGDKHSGKLDGKRSGSGHDDGSDSDSSSSDESYSSSSDSGSESGWLGRVFHTKDHDGKGGVTRLAGGVTREREGFADSSSSSSNSNSNVKCMPGCKMATSVNGDCRWLPKNEPRHKQRLICPHTCDTGFKTTGARCESNVDCTDCTPQPDFTVTGYTSFEVTQTANCTKGAPCVIKSSNSLEVCNPYASPNNPAQNLICSKKPGSETGFVWTEADSAAKQMPYHVDQSKLLACDVKQGCAVEGDSCMNSNFDKVYCHNNIWVSDPKYDKSSYSNDKKGSGSGTSGSSGKGGNNGKDSTGSGKNGVGNDSDGDNNNSDNNRDNYYITNYFYGPSKPESKYSLGLGFSIDGKNKKAQLQGSGSKVEERDDNDDDDDRNKPGFIDTIKKKFQKNKKNKPDPPTLGPGLYGNYGAGAGGNATVPPLVPKGEVATVQAYESTIKF